MNYQSLTSIPLFTGISGEDLALIMDRVELTEMDLEAGDVFIEQGDLCQHMVILREGSVIRSYTYDRGWFVNLRKQKVPLAYPVEEKMSGKMIIEPERLFGLSDHYQNSWKADTGCRLTLISKQDIRQTLMYVPVWRINYINMLSTRLQKSMNEQIPESYEETTDLCGQHILRHCSAEGESIRLGVTLEQMAYQLGLDRRMAVRALNKMEQEGWLRRERNAIVVPNIPELRKHAASRIEE